MLFLTRKYDIVLLAKKRKSYGGTEMSRSRGKRYNGEKKLNMKKVFAVIMVIVVLIMFVFVFKTLLTGEKGKVIASKTYFPSFQNEKYGVIDETGADIIAPSYEEYIIIPNQKKDVFLITYDVDYANNSYHTKALNSKNEEIFTDYEEVQGLLNHDAQNNVFFNGEVLKVKKNGKYGLIDFNGKEILSCEYDNISSLEKVDNSIKIEKDGKVGLVNNQGNEIIKPEYQDILAIDDNYQSGYIVKQENTYGILDVSGAKELDTKYSEIKPFSANSLYVAKENDKWQLVNRQGIKLEIPYDDILGMSGTDLIVKRGNVVGIIGTDGTEKIAPAYEEIAFAFSNAYLAKQNGMYGIIDSTGTTKIDFQYQSMSYNKEADLVLASKDGIETEVITNDFTIKLTGILSEMNTKQGYLRMREQDEYHYYNLKCEEKANTELLKNKTLYLSKKDGKYGYVDSAGNVKVDYQYEEATEQNDYGYAAVKKEGKWGCLDKEGNVLVTPSIDLSNSMIIDFIGTWHLTNDLNMNLYTK